MKITRLWIDGFKNLRDCDIEFHTPCLLNAIIGSNGSGKSNLIEAILHILIGAYFKKCPPFDFSFDFVAQRRNVSLTGEAGRLIVHVDDEHVPLKAFAQRLRRRPAQVYYPELTFVYYSGECQRVRKLIQRYRRDFQKITRNPETDSYRPLFVESTNQQSQVILLALIAHRDTQFLSRLGIVDAVNVSLTLRSPDGFDPTEHEPKLWNTVGAVRKIVAAIDEIAFVQDSERSKEPDTQLLFEPDVDSDGGVLRLAYSESRTYVFNDADKTNRRITDLADRLARSNDNLYLALEQLRHRGVFRSIRFQLKSVHTGAIFDFDQLSEGEKQLIAVVGAIRLTNQRDNLILLDEPDTHLNPHWSWEYPEMLNDAFDQHQRSFSTVLMATHDPIMISGMTKDQILLAHPPSENKQMFTRPVRDPRGQGVANLLCSSEYFGLPSSLDKETQKLLARRLQISVKAVLTEADKTELRRLNRQLEIISPGVSERDPKYVEFLRKQHGEEKG